MNRDCFHLVRWGTAALFLIAMIPGSAFAIEIVSVSMEDWVHLSDPAGEDVRYIEALPGEDVLFWRTSGNVLRRATYTFNPGSPEVTLGAPTSPTGLTSGDHPSILNLGGGNLEGYFHTGGGPGVLNQYHATSSDNGLTWTGESLVPYPFPTPPGAGIPGDSGTTGGGGILEIGGERRIYNQNNFGDIVLHTTTAGQASPLAAAGRLILQTTAGTASSGQAYSFQNQSPSGDAHALPNGEVLYFYTDGEGLEATQGAIGVLILDAPGLDFSDARDNFLAVTTPSLVSAGATSVDEMTISNVAPGGEQMVFLLFMCGDSTFNGNNEDIFWSRVTITFDDWVPVELSVFRED